VRGHLGLLDITQQVYHNTPASLAMERIDLDLVVGRLHIVAMCHGSLTLVAAAAAAAAAVAIVRACQKAGSTYHLPVTCHQSDPAQSGLMVDLCCEFGADH
jgi:hypothetical protein